VIAYSIIAVVLAAMRIMGHKSHSFQAAAHLFCGWLLAESFLHGGQFELLMVITLSIVEVACFIWFHFHSSGKPV
jgi:hypothetical protein